MLKETILLYETSKDKCCYQDKYLWRNFQSDQTFNSFFFKTTFHFALKTNLNVFSAFLKNMKNGPDGLPHSSLLQLRKDSFFLFHICSLEADIRKPIWSSKSQFGPECDGYENITGYIKNLNTITKEEIGGY